jgi:uncharacterized protein (DUF1501 family)
MFNFFRPVPAISGDHVTRRDFLKAGAMSAGAVGMTLADLTSLKSAANGRDVNCILLFLVGGPSQLETFDPKPDAPSHIRGPFGTIPTRIPGIRFSEHLPKTAQLANRIAILRSVHTDAAPIHENGQQLMQTGRLCRDEQAHPHYGSTVSWLKGPKAADSPPFVILPWKIGNTGVSIGHGQDAGFLGKNYQPLRATLDVTARSTKGLSSATQPFAGAAILSEHTRRAFNISSEDHGLRSRYGFNQFGQSCLIARRLIESGTRLVTVNMFDTVFNKATWDCHADGSSLATTLTDYRRTLCPMFDAAYSTLLEDLGQRGMLDNTLVLAMGEFGRTPKINPRGGRDHWTGCWSVLFAGGDIRGGQVVGCSDASAAEPNDRPIKPAEIAATVYAALGLNPALRLPLPGGGSLPLADAEPIRELIS